MKHPHPTKATSLARAPATGSRSPIRECSVGTMHEKENTMHKEVDILMRAAGKSCAVVEKESHMIWTLEDLREAHALGRFQAEDRILPPDGQLEISGPYPGCLQLGADGVSARYRPVGQTEHFVIFAPSQIEASNMAATDF
jgi:hypothetical protein